MGLILSILHSVFSYLNTTTTSGEKYVYRPLEKQQSIPEKPKIHVACRSTNSNKLTPYQSKIDNLKQTEIVFVSFSTTVM
jgi:hypothetical protein